MINASNLTVLDLGRRGTYGDVVYGFAMNGYEDCTATVLHQRYCDTAPYACTDVTIEDGFALWTVSIVDTFIDDNEADSDEVFGKLEVQFYKDGLLVKSAIWKTVVYNSLGPASETVPDAYQSWVDNIAQKSAIAVAASASAATSAAAASVSETNAKTSETNAAASASSASASSTSAAASAATSTSKASEAASSANTASAAANTATNKAVAAAASADSASNSAGASSDSAAAAQTAQSKAETAQSAAESAKTAAENAKTAAETAAAKSVQDYEVEKARAMAAESALDSAKAEKTALTAETSRATSAESTLNTAITNEVSRAKGVEATKANASDLVAEAEARKSADATLTSSIEAEASRAMAADSTLTDTKVGYSEVVNGQLLMYSDSSKEHLLATLDLPNSPVQDVQVAGTSVVKDGVANVPIATIGGISSSVPGAVKPHSNSFTILSQSSMIVKTGPATSINNRADKPTSSGGNVITADNLDYAVKAAMADGKGASWSDTEKAAARNRIGAAKEAGEWVLKGTISGDADDHGNIDTGVTVDLTGCTELYIVGAYNSTGSQFMATDTDLYLFAVSAGSKRVFEKLSQDCIGYSGIYSVVNSGTFHTYDACSAKLIETDIPISNIKRITFNNVSAITSCTIQIYAR